MSLLELDSTEFRENSVMRKEEHKKEGSDEKATMSTEKECRGRRKHREKRRKVTSNLWIRK